MEALPSRVLYADTVEIANVSRVTVNLHVGFGLIVRRHLLIEGVSPRDIPATQLAGARHGAVILLGKRRLVVQVAGADTLDGHVPARVYVDRDVTEDPAYMAVPYGMVKPRLEVGLFFAWMRQFDFDVSVVRDVVNKKYKKAA